MKKNSKLGLMQKGMTLLEVLVSMLVIGLGLTIGISMIQVSNRFGSSAEYASSALLQAQAIMDKMRANYIAAESYVFTGTTSSISADYSQLWAGADMSGITANNVPLCTPSPNCDAARLMAGHDLLEWRTQLDSLLPGGRGLIFDLGRGNFQVIVMWTDIAETEGGAQAFSGTNLPAHGIRVTYSL